MNADRASLAKWVVDRHKRLFTDRAPWEAFWEDTAKYVMPRKAEIRSQQSSPNTGRQERLFDSTATRANQILANGQLAWMTPLESRWFAYDPPASLGENDNVKQWYKRCTEIIALELARSNFYTEVHEAYLDRGCFGTAVMTCEEGLRGLFSFQALTCGSYALAEDSEKHVDTLARTVRLTARAAKEMFGEQLPPSLKKALEDSSQLDREFTFSHLCYPRTDFDWSKRDPEHKPLASVYVYEPEMYLCRVSGYDEQSFFATRFLRWGEAVYGWSPAWIALPEARQLNFLEKQMDALAEVAAFPRMLVPSGFKGTINLKANGVTYYNANDGKPEEWLTAGRYDIGKDRGELKRKAINDAYHVELFQMFAQIERQMTAREVAERAQEKLIQFSPAFARMTTEFFTPLLRRCFAIAFRAGALPEPPKEAVMVDAQGAYLPDPAISYSSRIALAIKQLENSSFFRLMESLSPLASMRPDLLDNFDFDEIYRDLARNEGLPSRWIVPEEEVAQMRAMRAQQAQQAQQMQMMQAGADAAQKVGGVKPDSLAAQLLEGAT